MLLNTANFLVNNPLEQFEINDFVFLLAPIFGFTKLSLTNIGFYLILVVSIVLAMNLLASNHYSLIPSRWSISQESIYNSVLNLVRTSIGPKYEIYFPVVYSVFTFILIGNLVGLIPYSYTVTSQLIVCVGLSFALLLGVTILGLHRHGLALFSLFIPTGTPLGLVPVLVLLELLSYLSRFFSLGIRLFANMVAGHVLLKIVSTSIWGLVLAVPAFATLSVLPLLLMTALAALELLVALLQAYVFTILFCSYINDVINLHTPPR